MFGFWNHEELGWVLTSTLTSFMILNKLLNLSELNFNICSTVYLGGFTESWGNIH